MTANDCRGRAATRHFLSLPPLGAADTKLEGIPMKKIWSKPVVTERPAGMEVTAYLPAGF